MPTRQPSVAGRFYEGFRERLLSELAKYIPPCDEKVKALGILSPHAGYVYSGKIAGEVYSRIDIPDTVLIACPNHTGTPVEFSVWSEGEWETPLGPVPIDEDLAARILASCRAATSDTEAHRGEHSAEVHLPFLQHLRPEVRIVPVAVRTMELSRLKDFGRGLAEALRQDGREVLIVASSDMTHFESHESAKERDRLAIDRMLEMDEDGLWDTVRRHQISMCGCGPAVIMLHAVKELGATQADLVRYSTSGEVFGDYDRVVGYAGMIFR